MMHKLYTALSISILSLIICANASAAPYLPEGIFSSHVGRDVGKYINNSDVSGALVRVRWSEIETREGNFNFSAIERQRKPIVGANKQWSLGIIAGANVPEWMLHKTKERMTISFRGKQKEIIPFWSKTYQKYAQRLAQALAQKYGRDKNLVLVYIPQQTSNGIEGHFNGNTSQALASQGLTPKNWLWAVKQSLKSFTKAFPNKAIAIELHELLNSADIPRDIIRHANKTYGNQVGVGVWWLSGKTHYQKNLLALLENKTLPVYAQVIGKSSQPRRFANNDYTSIFSQAKKIGASYIEVWNYELENDVDVRIKKAIRAFDKSYSH